MTKRITQKQLDKAFVGASRDLYDKFRENALMIYDRFFTVSPVKKSDLIPQIAERLFVEFSVLCSEKKALRGRKNDKKVESV